MRIISGTHKGRRISTPKNLDIRPTTDFAKEGLFNMLRNIRVIADSKVLDLCAGSGGISFEFASREAASILSIDQNFACVKFIKSFAQSMGFSNIKALKMDVFQFLKNAKGEYDIIFVDPPYAMEKLADLPELILNKKLLAEDGLLIVEHGKEHNFENHQAFYSSRRFGNVNFTFFEPITASS